MMFKHGSNSNCNVIFQPFEFTVVSETQQKWTFWSQTVGAALAHKGSPNAILYNGFTTPTQAIANTWRR